MSPVQVAEGGEFTLPDCAYHVDGCTFDGWTVAGSDGGESFNSRPGDSITVDRDLTVMACWLWDDTATEDQAEAVQDEPDAESEIEVDEVPEEIVMDIEAEEVAEEADSDVAIVDVEDDSPSEVGSVFSGAGIAAIVAAVALVLAGAVIAVIRKKKR